MVQIVLTDSAAAGPRFPYPRQHYHECSFQHVITRTHLRLYTHCFNVCTRKIRYIYSDGEIFVENDGFSVLDYNIETRIRFNSEKKVVKIIYNENKVVHSSILDTPGLIAYFANNYFGSRGFLSYFANDVDKFIVKDNHYNAEYINSYKQYTVMAGYCRICIYINHSEYVLKDRPGTIVMKRDGTVSETCTISNKTKKYIAAKFKFIQICLGILKGKYGYLDDDTVLRELNNMWDYIEGKEYRDIDSRLGELLIEQLPRDYS